MVDNNLSPLPADYLKAAGHNVAHVRDYGLRVVSDPVILAQARGDSRVLLSADTDFGNAAGSGEGRRPSTS